MNKIYRQGDVLLVQTSERPRNTKPVPRENGLVILAHGEITGHHHSLVEETVELVTAEEANELFLLVHGLETVSLTHQEHATITVDPGTYKVIRQREYTPEAIRNVQD